MKSRVMARECMGYLEENSLVLLLGCIYSSCVALAFILSVAVKRPPTLCGRGQD